MIFSDILSFRFIHLSIDLSNHLFHVFISLIDIPGNGLCFLPCFFVSESIQKQQGASNITTGNGEVPVDVDRGGFREEEHPLSDIID